MDSTYNHDYSLLLLSIHSQIKELFIGKKEKAIARNIWKRIGRETYFRKRNYGLNGEWWRERMVNHLGQNWTASGFLWTSNWSQKKTYKLVEKN